MCIPGRQHDMTSFELADIRVLYDGPHELFGNTAAHWKGSSTKHRLSQTSCLKPPWQNPSVVHPGKPQKRVNFLFWYQRFPLACPWPSNESLEKLVNHVGIKTDLSVEISSSVMAFFFCRASFLTLMQVFAAGSISIQPADKDPWFPWDSAHRTCRP